MRLSEHFTLREMTRSQTADRLGLDNSPGPDEVDAMKRLCERVLEPIRERFGPFSPSSGYRGPEVNRAIGGAENSSHMRGEAADLEVVGVSNLELARWIKDSDLDFDQLILEYYVRGRPSSGWVHVSYVSKARNRDQCLTMVKGVGYVPGIVS